MDDELICSSIDVIDEEIRLLECKLEELYDKKSKLQELCCHNVVFRTEDSGLYKVGTVYNYVCPICGLSMRICDCNLENSSFRNSNIIDLDIDLKDSNITLKKIL